jgi:hypothetical protein
MDLFTITIQQIEHFNKVYVNNFINCMKHFITENVTTTYIPNGVCAVVCADVSTLEMLINH